MTTPSSMDDSPLLPCPFCGKQPRVDDVDDERDCGYVPDDCLPIKSIVIRCCGTELYKDTMKQAADAWNTRPTPSPTAWQEGVEATILRLESLYYRGTEERPLAIPEIAYNCAIDACVATVRETPIEGDGL